MSKWIPKDGEIFWSIHIGINYIPFICCHIRGSDYSTDSNCFRTKKEAQEALKKVKEVLK